MLVLYPSATMVKRRRPGISTRLRLIQQLSGEQNHRCCHCGGKLLFRDDVGEIVNSQLPNHYATLEHVIPHRYGGGWTYENLAVAHYCCNKYYTDHTSSGFYKYRRILKQKLGINLKLHPENTGLQTIENGI